MFLNPIDLLLNDEKKINETFHQDRYKSIILLNYCTRTISIFIEFRKEFRKE